MIIDSEPVMVASTHQRSREAAGTGAGELGGAGRVSVAVVIGGASGRAPPTSSVVDYVIAPPAIA
jgi:hypothetical protein